MMTMETVKIPWADGGGNITISPSGEGVVISSDTNDGVERSQVLTFRTTDGTATATLTVTQKGGRVVLKDASGLILRDSSNQVLTAKLK